jgi:hypothetical protein
MKASNFPNPLKQVFLFVFLFLGCQTIEENQDNPIDPRYNAASLSIKDPNLIPFQFGVIETSGISELKESYKGDLNGVEVDLHKFEDKSLVLIIPEVAQGKHRLKVNMGNQEKTLELNIGAAKDKINGDQAFKTFTSQIDDYLNNHLPAGSGELGILMAELNARLKIRSRKTACF